MDLSLLIKEETSNVFFWWRIGFCLQPCTNLQWLSSRNCLRALVYFFLRYFLENLDVWNLWLSARVVRKQVLTASLITWKLNEMYFNISVCLVGFSILKQLQPKCVTGSQLIDNIERDDKLTIYNNNCAGFEWPKACHTTSKMADSKWLMGFTDTDTQNTLNCKAW